MILDYKDYNSYFKQKEKTFFLKCLLFFIAIAILIISIIYIISWKNNKEVQKLLSDLKISEAENFINTHYVFFFHNKNINEATALIKLSKGIKNEALLYFSNNFPSSIPIYWKKYIDLFISKGDYKASKIYIDYLKKNKSSSQDFILNDSDCLISTIINNFRSINNCIEKIKTPSFKNLAINLSAIEKKSKFNWFYDRNDTPLVYRDLKTNKTEYLDPSINWLKPEFLKLDEKDYYNKIYLSIDIKLQKLAYEKLGKYEGVFLLIKKNGELLAAVSKSKDENNILLFKLLKPGSITKIITTSSAFRNNIDLNKIFPLECKGFIVPYDKLIFYDWIEHKQVNDIIDALASSCNISFGLIGHYIGRNLLINELKNFGISTEIPFEGMALKAGEIIENTNDPLYDYSLAIGDKYILVNPLLTALWALSIINDGISMKPVFIKEKRNLLNISYENSKEEIFLKFTKEQYLKAIREGMIKAVDSEIGTGKRAKIADFKIALKTGTAGEKTPNYDAIIIGYAPADNPKIAFSLFALKAGKASLEGARVIKDFFTSAAPMIK